MSEQQIEVSRIYQLSHLGLPSQLFITVLLAELHRLLPSYSNSYIWMNDHGQISHFFDECHNLQFGAAFNDPVHADLVESLSSWLMKLSDISESQDYFFEDPALSSIFNELMLPSGYLNSLFLPVRSGRDGRCIGVMMLHRKHRGQQFTSQEKALCQSVLPLLIYGLNHAGSRSSAFTDGWQQGLLIIDRHARLQHASNRGKILLSLALSHQPYQHHLPILANLQYITDIDNLIKQLFKDDQKRDSHNDMMLYIDSAWGSFCLTGFLIHDCEGQRAPQIGINIRWQVPFLLKLFHAIPNLNLTLRQQSVALFYASGCPTKVMACKLELSIYTVKEHIRNIFERLQVRSRAELIEKLLCTP